MFTLGVYLLMTEDIGDPFDALPSAHVVLEQAPLTYESTNPSKPEDDGRACILWALICSKSSASVTLPTPFVRVYTSDTCSSLISPMVGFSLKPVTFYPSSSSVFGSFEIRR